jgi:hypothetical protein
MGSEKLGGNRFCRHNPAISTKLRRTRCETKSFAARPHPNLLPLGEGTGIARLGLGACASGKSQRWYFATAADVSPPLGPDEKGGAGERQIIFKKYVAGTTQNSTVFVGRWNEIKIKIRIKIKGIGWWAQAYGRVVHWPPHDAVFGLAGAKQGEFLPKGVESPGRFPASLLIEKNRFRMPVPNRGNRPGFCARPRPMKTLNKLDF